MARRPIRAATGDTRGPDHHRGDLSEPGRAGAISLVERFRNAWGLNRPDVATYYTQGAGGYTTYPRLRTPSRTR